MTPAWHIREGQTADLDRLCELEQASFSYDQIGRRSFRHLLLSPTARVFLVEQPGTAPALLAYAIVLTRKNSRYWRLYSMATSSAARGQGIGKHLLTHILETAQHSPDGSAGGMRLEVKCSNTAGLGLYRQLGFEITDILPAYYSDDSDGYRMQLTFA
ncbi:MAG: N-acetyltransferase [Idiomarina sp.]|nr:N-acetyltransferase [Idiomarina sp.]